MSSTPPVRRLLPLTWIDLLKIACAVVHEPAADGVPSAVDIATFKAAEAAARLVSQEATPSAAGVIEELVHVLVRGDGFVGTHRSSFFHEVAMAFASVNDLYIALQPEDVRAMLAFEILSVKHERPHARQEARAKARRLFHRVVLTRSDSVNWTQAPEGRPQVPTAVVLSPMRSARDERERDQCDDIVLLISAEIQRRTGWDVHPCALIERDDPRYGRALAVEHDDVIRTAQAVVVVVTPPSFGVGWAARALPDDVPRMYLAERGAGLCHYVEPHETRYWSTEQELLDAVGAFAESALRRARVDRPVLTNSPQPVAGAPRRRENGVSSGTRRAAARQPSHARRRRVDVQPDPQFLPGLDDINFVGAFRVESENDDRSVAVMRAVLDHVDWKNRRWLTEKELATAQLARAEFEWTNAEFNDSAAFMNMTRAYEHFAPSSGVRTKVRAVDSAYAWDRVRRRRRSL